MKPLESPVTIEVPYEQSVECPVCKQPVPVFAHVQVKGGVVQHAGTQGMRPILSTYISGEPFLVEFSHTCNYTDPKDD